MKQLILILSLLIGGGLWLPLTAQSVRCGGATAFQILHFTKTNGFDHQTRDVSAQLFTELGQTENFTVVNTESATAFDDLSELLNYEVVVFSNTSGNNLLDATQQANLEAYIAAGGAFLGMHAATDTYRNQSWPFYNQLVGGIVQRSPNHTNQNYVGTMDVIGSHPSTTNLPDPWEKEEEYYYWELNGGQLSPDIIETLRVRSTGGESYDVPRPVAWYQEFPSGARSYYTALGHKTNNYTDPDNDFRRLLRDALCWCVAAEATSSVEPAAEALRLPRLRATVVRGELAVWLPPGPGHTASLFALSGQELRSAIELAPGWNAVALTELPAGSYLLRFARRDWPPLRFSKQ